MKKTTKKTTVSVAPAVAPSAPVAAKAPAKSPTLTAVTAAPIATAKSVVPVKAATTTKTPIITAAAPITIEAKIDIGFGNNLYVRGQGAGLSWERGTPLECVDSQTWRLIVPAKDKLQFKLLLNDTVWAQGDDVVATPGKKVEVVPAF